MGFCPPFGFSRVQITARHPPGAAPAVWGILIQKYQTALGIQEPERSYTTGNSPPLVSALLAARPQRGVRPFSYVCTDTNQFLVPQPMFSSSAQRGPHAAECDLLKSLAPGLSSLSVGIFKI